MLEFIGKTVKHQLFIFFKYIWLELLFTSYFLKIFRYTLLMFHLQNSKITSICAWSLTRLSVNGMFLLNFEFGMPA